MDIRFKAWLGKVTKGAAHRQIALGGLISAVLLVFGKAIGAAKEAAIAWRFGTDIVVDAYQLATTVAFWAPTTLVSCMSIVLIPAFVQTRDQVAADLFNAELKGFLFATGCVLAGLSVLVVIAFRQDYGILGRNITSLALWFCPSIPLLLLSGAVTSRLLAARSYSVTLIDAAPALVLLALVLTATALEPTATLGIGTTVGIAVQLGVLSVIEKRSLRPTQWVRFGFATHTWRQVGRAFLAVITGQVVMGLAIPIDQVFAVSQGQGAVATLSYANRVLALFLGLGSVVIARALLPVISAVHADSPTKSATLGRKWATLMFVAGSLVAAATALVAPALIELLFQRGAFSRDDTAAVATCLQFGVLQLPFYFCGLVAVQVLAVHGKYWLIAQLALTNLLVKVIAIYPLTAQLGVNGIQLSSAAMYMWSASILLFCMYRLSAKQ